MHSPKTRPSFIPPDLTIPRAISAEPLRSQARSDAVHSYRRHKDRLHAAVQVVADRVRIDSNSRVAHWVRDIDRLSKADKRNVLVQITEQLRHGRWDHPFRDSFIALTESRAFVDIVEQLADHLTNRDLRELVSGHPDPSLDRPSARGRDKEFEWYVAALLRRAGLPIALAEPDVLVEVRGDVRSIAAKRLLSKKKVESNIKKASDQIAGAGYPGYIVLDLTRYIDPEMQFMEHAEQDGQAIALRVNAFTRRSAVTNPRNPLVAGVFARTAYPLISPGFRYGTSEKWFGIGINTEYREEHIYLLHAILSGMD
jgi:hypothetical protein